MKTYLVCEACNGFYRRNNSFDQQEYLFEILPRSVSDRLRASLSGDLLLTPLDTSPVFSTSPCASCGDRDRGVRYPLADLEEVIR